MNWINPCLDVLTITGLSILHISFVTRLTGIRQKTWHIPAYFLLLGLLQITSVCFSIPGTFSVALELAALYFINRSALKAGSSVSMVSAVLAVYISQLSFGIVNSIESLILPFSMGSILLYFLLFLATFATFGLCACCYLLVLKFLSLDSDLSAPCIRLLLLPGLFFFSAELYIVHTAYSTVSFNESLRKQFALFLLQLLGLAALLCTLYAYRCICAGFQAQAENASLLQAARAQKAYVAEARIRYERTKAFRHDIRSHLAVLEGLLDTGQPEHARNYLKKLENLSSSLSFSWQTHNPVLDILLAEKLGAARANGITAEVSLILPEACGIDDFDLCIIFSNVLDNAVNACLLTNSERRISIRGECQGGLYMLEFENTCSPQALPPAGTGLSNINAAVKKYRGAVQIEKTADTFRLSILLNTQPGSISIP